MTTKAELQIEYAGELNDRLHAIDMALESSRQNGAHDSIRDGVERALPGLRKNLQQLILKVVLENIEPGDKAAFQELFTRVRNIVAEERGEIMAHLAKQKYSTLNTRNIEFARARQMLVELNQFERLAAEYEGAIFAMFVESESESETGIERVQF